MSITTKQSLLTESINTPSVDELTWLRLNSGPPVHQSTPLSSSSLLLLTLSQLFKTVKRF